MKINLILNFMTPKPIMNKCWLNEDKKRAVKAKSFGCNPSVNALGDAET
jgi:hypothetical protein